MTLTDFFSFILGFLVGLGIAYWLDALLFTPFASWLSRKYHERNHHGL